MYFVVEYLGGRGPWAEDKGRELRNTNTLWSLFLSSRKKHSMWVQTLWETNHKIKTIIFKNLFFNVKFLMNKSRFFSVSWTYFQRSSRSQVFFKIRALKHLTILRIKKRLQHRRFPVRSSHREVFLKKGVCSFLQADWC